MKACTESTIKKEGWYVDEKIIAASTLIRFWRCGYGYFYVFLHAHPMETLCTEIWSIYLWYEKNRTIEVPKYFPYLVENFFNDVIIGICPGQQVHVDLYLYIQVPVYGMHIFLLLFRTAQNFSESLAVWAAILING